MTDTLDIELLSCPLDFEAASIELWDESQRALKRQDTWQDSDAPALERYVRAVDLAAKLREAIAGDFIVLGSKGQPRANPLIGALQQAESDANKYAAVLLLTPESRRKAGVTVEEKGTDGLEDVI